MILYLCSGRHSYTVKGWLDHYDEASRGTFNVQSYQELQLPSPPPRTCIFSDVERLTPVLARSLTPVWERLAAAGCRMLNHPERSLRRFGLQQALGNKFRLFREQLPPDARFPVFLRGENDHNGSLTPLLYTREEVRQQWSLHPKAIAIEFLDTSDWRGIYRKYSVFRIGDHLIPRHVLFSRRWQVKNPDLVTPSRVKEEMNYLLRFPHKEEILRAFDAGGIEYGRIDYSIHKGRIQVWEINTNPILKTAANTGHPERAAIHERSARDINAALLQLQA